LDPNVDAEPRRKLGVETGVGGAMILGPAPNFFLVAPWPAPFANFFIGVRPALYYGFFAASGQWLKSIPAKLQAQFRDFGWEFVGARRLCDSHSCDPSMWWVSRSVMWRGSQLPLRASTIPEYKLLSCATRNPARSICGVVLPKAFHRFPNG